MKMNFYLKPVLIIFLLFFHQWVTADVPPKQEKEVAHLLNFIEHSNCIINRNGNEYPAIRANAHIESKYDYFRDDIKNTEDFILLSATKSTMSGKFYIVSCPGEKTIKTQDWLLHELKRFRLNVTK